MENNAHLGNEGFDPVVELLQRSLEKMVGETDHRIDHIKKEIVNDILSRSIPNYLLCPVPLMAMLQLQKKGIRKSTKDPITNTQGASFSFKSPKDNRTLNFMSLINANIFNGRVVEVRKGQLENTWEVALEMDEWVDNLSGLAFFINNADVPVGKIEISNGLTNIPIAMMSDYNQLPFSNTLIRYMQYSSNEKIYKLLMHWHDILLSKSYSYCIIRPYRTQDIPLRQDGKRILLNLVLKESVKKTKIEKNDILLNCIPVINVDEGFEMVSELKRLNLEEGKYLIADDVSENPFLKKRKYGTTREGVETNKEVYIALHRTEDNRKYHFIHYLYSDGEVPVIRGDELSSVLAEFSSATVIDTFPYKEPQQETENVNGLFHLQTHDRIVTPTDILSFCKTKLATLFNYNESEIKSMEWNREECKALIWIEGGKEREEADIVAQEAALKAMLLKRTALLTPINIDIIYHCKQ